MTRWIGGISRLYADRRYPRGRILGASAVAVSGAADTAENILATINVPAGAMGLNGKLRLYTLFTVTSSANNKTLRARLGGIGGTIFYGVTVTTTVTVTDQRIISNRGAANSQVGPGDNSASFSQSNTVATTGAISTAAATTLVITGQKASAGETLTLEDYLVELIIP